MQTPLSVTSLNNQIKSLLESHYLSFAVEGEVSRPTYHTSGHLYFTLKDKDSAISCVMFKGNCQKLKFKVEEGLKVIISGGLSVYTPRGSYQINCASMEPSGSGALALAYEQLKEKLKNKGYFETEYKKSLPKFPRNIALVTSKTGAALQDMLNVATKRWPLVKITLFDTLVQGENAAPSIAKQIALADDKSFDVIVVARGGGSVEDLWAFNEEVVADAIFAAHTPLVSAVGHEIDFLISDFVADLRAPTPSAAMELILPDQNEMRITLDTLTDRYQSLVKGILHQKQKSLEHALALLKQNSFDAKLSFQSREIEAIKKRYEAFSKLLIAQKTQQIQQLLNAFSLNDPSKKDKIGFAQISQNGVLIDLKKLKVDAIFEAQTSKVTLKARVLEIVKTKETI